MNRFRWSKEVPALLLMGLFFLLLLSFVSFDIADNSEWHSPANATARNWCGPIGAWLSMTLFHWFGLGSYAMLILMAVWGVRMLRREPIQGGWLRGGGTVVLLVTMCAAFGIIPGPSESARMPGYGGILGISLAHVLGTHFGAAGRVLVILTLMTLSFLLAADVMLADLLLFLKRRIVGHRAAQGQESQGNCGEGREPAGAAGSAAVEAGRDGEAARRRQSALSPTPSAAAYRSRQEEPPTRRPFGLPKRQEEGPCEPVAQPLAPGAERRLPGTPPEVPVFDGELLEESSVSAIRKAEEAPTEFSQALEQVQHEMGSESVIPAADAAGQRRESELDPLRTEKCKVVLGSPKAPQASPATQSDNRPNVVKSDAIDLSDATVDPIIIISKDGVPAHPLGEALVNREMPEAVAPSGTQPPDQLASSPTTALEGGSGGDNGSGRPAEGAGGRVLALSEDHIDTHVNQCPRPQAGEACRESEAGASDGSEQDSQPGRGALGNDQERVEEAKGEARADQDEGGASPEDAPDGLEEKMESLRIPAQPRMPEPRRVPRPRRGKFTLPSTDLLNAAATPRGRELESRQKVRQLETALENFKIGAEVVDIQRGPTVTMFEIALAPGVKVNKVISLADDLAIAMRAESVRIVAPIPGKSTVGIEIPNDVKERVQLRDLISGPEFQNGEYILPVFLGRDVAGSPVITDLTSMPHLLIAGATGSGKSVCINSLIASILMTQPPDDVRFVLIDPKMVELSGFEDIPHLLSPVVTDMKKAPGVLEWAVKKMDERYDILATVGVRHIKQFNQLGEERIRRRLMNRDADVEEIPFHLPYIIVVVDEYADLMMLASKEIEKSITRLSQKSRAVGIHVVLATQRPSVDVITGLIKANMTVRIAFKVSSKVDSRTILDRNGAEKLVGQGDMLFLPPGRSELIRCQGTFVADEELNQIVSYLKAQDMPDFEPELDDMEGLDDEENGDFAQRDRLYEQAVRIILQSGRGSVSLLQRKLEIGYTRAARLMDFMAKEGIVGGYKGSKAREVLMTLHDWEEEQKAIASTN
jgi:DNA segregation ATPase FtsK/SpoIIIE-like protein